MYAYVCMLNLEEKYNIKWYIPAMPLAKFMEE